MVAAVSRQQLGLYKYTRPRAIADWEVGQTDVISVDNDMSVQVGLRSSASCFKLLYTYNSNTPQYNTMHTQQRSMNAMNIILIHAMHALHHGLQWLLTVSLETGDMCSVEHELTQMSFNSRVNSFIVSCEFELTHPNRCEL